MQFRMAFWLAGLVPSLLGSGVFVFLVGIGIVHGFRSMSRDASILYEGLCVPLAISMVAFRRQFQRASAAFRVATILACMVTVAVPLALFLRLF